MPRTVSKAANNIFCKARINASKYNDKLASREGTSELSGISMKRIIQTETEAITPYPEEVLVYSELYNAPELISQYCAMLCPIGRETMEPVAVSNLEQASLKLLASTRCISELREQLVDIVMDGKVDESEQEDMQKILESLKQASNDIKALEVAYTKLLGAYDRMELKAL